VTLERPRAWARRLGLLLGVCLAAAPARAQEPPPAAPPPAEPPPAAPEVLAPYRTPFPVLVERTLGSTSRPVAYDWRRSKVQVAATGGQPVELNTFQSLRAGVAVRVPRNGLLWDLGLSGAWSWDTDASQALALTPYRQPGKPPRLEIDAHLGVPLAEGLVTARPRWFPSVQMVFVGWVGLRYAIYPGSLEGLRVREGLAALFRPTLGPAERANLEDARLDAMVVDPTRYTPMVGLGNDLYIRQGVFLAPRVSVALPLTRIAEPTALGWWGEASVAAGVAF
jgi:hypothetical protein